MNKTLTAITKSIQNCKGLNIISHFRKMHYKNVTKMEIDSTNPQAYENIEKAPGVEKYSFEIKKSSEIFVYDLFAYKNPSLA